MRCREKVKQRQRKKIKISIFGEKKEKMSYFPWRRRKICSYWWIFSLKSDTISQHWGSSPRYVQPCCSLSPSWSRSLGSLNYLHLWHDNSSPGRSSSWFVKYFIVRDLQTLRKDHSSVNDGWLWSKTTAKSRLERLIFSVTIFWFLSLRSNVCYQWPVNWRKNNSRMSSPSEPIINCPMNIFGIRSSLVHSPGRSLESNDVPVVSSCSFSRCFWTSCTTISPNHRPAPPRWPSGPFTSPLNKFVFVLLRRKERRSRGEWTSDGWFPSARRRRTSSFSARVSVHLSASGSCRSFERRRSDVCPRRTAERDEDVGDRSRSTALSALSLFSRLFPSTPRTRSEQSQREERNKSFLNLLFVSQIVTIDDYWSWLEESFVSNLRAQLWYNGDSPRYLRGFLKDKTHRLIGWPLMRQIRVRSSECSSLRSFFWWNSWPPVVFTRRFKSIRSISPVDQFLFIFPFTLCL